MYIIREIHNNHTTKNTKRIDAHYINEYYPMIRSIGSGVR